MQAKLGAGKRDKKARRAVQTHVKFSHCRQKPQPGKLAQQVLKFISLGDRIKRSVQ